MNNTEIRISFKLDKETAKALTLITKNLGRGNQSEAIRRAIIDAAGSIQLTESLARMDRGERLDQSAPR